MLVLGIESSCDETAAAVVGPGGTIRSSVVASQVPVHAKYGGVVPELASRNHVLAILPAVERALGEAGVTLDEVDGLAVTQGPGLIGALLVGLQTAKGIAFARGLPLVGVDHVAAHIHALQLVHPEWLPAHTPRPTAPFLALAVSGGHTSLYVVEEAPGPEHPEGRLQPIAHTLDDAAGEAFDKAAKLLGLPYPGGVSIERLARQGDPTAIPLPRPLPERARRAFSFSGLKTAVRLAVQELGNGASESARADVAAAVQEAIVEHLVRKTVQAAEDMHVPQVAVSGGVAANGRLREALQEATQGAGLELFLTPPALCTDNAAMVAGLGQRMLEAGAGLAGETMLSMDAYANQSFRRWIRDA